MLRFILHKFTAIIYGVNTFDHVTNKSHHARNEEIEEAQDSNEEKLDSVQVLGDINGHQTVKRAEHHEDTDRTLKQLKYSENYEKMETI